jgi:hypothetical protein
VWQRHQGSKSTTETQLKWYSDPYLIYNTSTTRVEYPSQFYVSLDRDQQWTDTHISYEDLGQEQSNEQKNAGEKQKRGEMWIVYLGCARRRGRSCGCSAAHASGPATWRRTPPSCPDQPSTPATQRSKSGFRNTFIAWRHRSKTRKKSFKVGSPISAVYIWIHTDFYGIQTPR